MENVSFNYSDEEYGWVSEDIVLTDNIVLLISLKEKGVIVVEKRNPDEAEWPKVCLTKPVKDAELKFYGECEGMVLRVLTAAEPESMGYVRIGATN